MQRLFMYPQMFVFGLAWIRRDRSVLPYMFFLSLIGGAIGVYHWVKDMLAVYAGVTIPCPAVSALPSCDKMYVFELGYVTIPMIALNAFIWVLLITWFAMRQEKEAASR
jgi:disulfide bond formation protein DsbB